jgi:hypothetical protein
LGQILHQSCCRTRRPPRERGKPARVRAALERAAPPPAVSPRKQPGRAIALMRRAVEHGRERSGGTSRAASATGSMAVRARGLSSSTYARGTAEQNTWQTRAASALSSSSASPLLCHRAPVSVSQCTPTRNASRVRALPPASSARAVVHVRGSPGRRRTKGGRWLRVAGKARVPQLGVCVEGSRDVCHGTIRRVQQIAVAHLPWRRPKPSLDEHARGVDGIVDLCSIPASLPPSLWEGELWGGTQLGGKQELSLTWREGRALGGRERRIAAPSARGSFDKALLRGKRWRTRAPASCRSSTM